MRSIHYKRLSFKNGYAYQDCSLPLDNQGLVLVRGLNLDDGGFLGAGKTSPFEVLASLQVGHGGKQRKGERHLADDIVNQAVGQDFEARLELELDGAPYEIVQYRKHKLHGNAYQFIEKDTGRNLIPRTHAKHPHLWVQQYSTLDDKSFSLIYLAQDLNNVMLHGTDGDRQQSIIQMFGLDIYDELLRITKARIAALGKVAQDVTDLRQELKGIEAELAAYPDSLQITETRLATAQAQVLEVQQRHDRAADKIDTLHKLLRQLEMRRQGLQEIRRLWDKQVLELDSPSEVTRGFCKELRNAADAAAQRVAELQNASQLASQRDVIEKRLETLVDRDEAVVQRELEKVRNQLRKLTNEDLPKAERRAEILGDLRKLKRPRVKLDTTREELEEVQRRRQKLEAELATIDDNLKSGICPTCKRPLKLSEAEVKSQRKRQRALRAELEVVSKQAHEISAQYTDDSRYEELTENLKAIGDSASPLDVQREISRFTKQERQLVSEQEGSRIRTTLVARLAALPEGSPKKLQRLCKEAEALAATKRRQFDVAVAILRERKKIKGLPRGNADALQERIDKANRVVRKTADRLTKSSTKVASMERKLDAHKQLLARRDKIRQGIETMSSVQEELTCLQALEQAFGSKGLKRDRFQAILRDATDQTVPTYVQTLWPKRNAKLQLVEQTNAVRVELQRGDLSIGSRLLSGGERTKAGLALLFGMRDLKEKYAGLATNLLILDEPFGNLDRYSTEHLLRVLGRLKRRFGTIFVIGNQSDVLESPVWDQTWWAVRDRHVATLYRDGLPKRYRAQLERYEAA